MKRLMQIQIALCIMASYVIAAPILQNYNNKRKEYPEGRLSLLDWQGYSHTEPEGPGTYAFGYDIEEPQNDNVQFRHEERHLNGTVTGSYGFVTPDGNVHVINYIADNLGYRASAESRHRGFGKPVKVNEEQDIQDAIAAVNYAKKTDRERMHTNRYQDYSTMSNKHNDQMKNFVDPNTNSVGNYETNSNPKYIQEKYKIFNNVAPRNDRRVHFPK